MTKIVTHRGLDPSKPNYFMESSVEAFADQLDRGFGLEFDVQFTKDNAMIAMHDSTLMRLTGGKDKRTVHDIFAKELLGKKFGNGHLTTVTHVLELIAKAGGGRISAFHLKHLWQSAEYLNVLLPILEKASSENLIVFDVKPETANFLRAKGITLGFAASVSHPYDIKRYNTAVGGTLMSIDEAIANRDIFDWVWLDEWDRSDGKGGDKTLYNDEVFKELRSNGFKIGLVTPELHGTSPGLLGGEAHPDAATKEKLFVRIKEILALKPDLVCTDYPDEVKALIQ